MNPYSMVEHLNKESSKSKTVRVRLHAGVHELGQMVVPQDNSARSEFYKNVIQFICLQRNEPLSSYAWRLLSLFFMASRGLYQSVSSFLNSRSITFA